MAAKKTAAKTAKTEKVTVKDVVSDVIETVKKDTAEAVAEIKAEAAEKKTAAAKKPATAKKTVENIYIQQNGSEVSTADMVEKAKALAEIQNPKTVDIYVRPEINTVYYVIDGEIFGNFELV